MAAVLVVAVVVLAAVVAAVLVLTRRSGAAGGLLRTPSACWLLSRPQVAAYVPGAVSNADGNASFCTWDPPSRQRDAPGRLTVGVEVLGDRPSVKEAENEYGIRRRQADKPGTTIMQLKIGDETFMACDTAHGTAPRRCTTYTRVRNVVFSLEFESFAVPDARDPATSVRALAADAVVHLRGSGE